MAASSASVAASSAFVTPPSASATQSSASVTQLSASAAAYAHVVTSRLCDAVGWSDGWTDERT
jgi:hypothetical protein